MLDVPLFSEEDEIATEDEMTEEDIDEMPAELREIYEMYDERTGVNLKDF
jgi:hypothetical protein